MFIGRKEEKASLEEIYNSNRNNLLVLYGRLGIGKSSLIFEFLKDKKAIYYSCRELTEREQKLQIQEELSYLLEGDENQSYENYYDILTALLDSLNLNENEKQILVLDEFDKIAFESREFIEAMLKITEDSSRKLMIVFASSSVNFVEQSMVSVLGSLAYKITGFMKLKPLSFAQTVEWFSKVNVEDCILLNAIFGGIPKYLSLYQDNRRLKDNIISLILQPNSKLFDEAEFVLKCELRELAAYNTILCALASGLNKLNDIYHRTGFSRAKISVYIKNLIQMDVVEKVFSFDTKDKTQVQKGLYRIKDNLIEFYYRFVFPNKSKLENNQAKKIYEEVILPDLPNYVREHFSKVCNEFLKLMSDYGKLDYKYIDSGVWYGKAGTIDIIMKDDLKNYLTAFCIWENVPCEKEILVEIKNLLDLAKINPKEIYIFSKSGFSEEFTKIIGENSHIKLVPLDSL